MMQNIMNSTRPMNTQPQTISRDIGANINTPLGQSILGITKYCERANCQKHISYNRLKTGGNDPSISNRMKYAKYVNGSVGKCTKLLDPTGNVVSNSLTP